MFNQSLEELAEKIRLYRESRATHGYDQEAGQVSVMLHTFVWENPGATLEQARASFCEYLKSASYLLNAIAYSRGQKVDLASLSEQDVNDYLSFVFDRLISTQRVLFGTPESCLEVVEKLKAVGVTEIACQMDFGIDVGLVLQSLPYLNRLKELSAQGGDKQGDKDVSLSYTVVSPQGQADPEGSHKGAPLPNAQGDHKGAPLPYAVASPLERPPAAHPLKGNHLQEIQRRGLEEASLIAFYNRLQRHGIQLAASFQGIEQLWRRDGEALGLVQLPKALEQETELYRIHPALLDACFQVLIATLPVHADSNGAEALYLPTGMRSFRVHERPGKRAWSHALLTSSGEQDAGLFEGDVRVLDEEGQVLVEASGLRLQRTELAVQPRKLEDLSDWLYELRWEPKPLGKVRADSPPEPKVSFESGGGGLSTKTERFSRQQTGRWLIFMDSSGVGQRIVDLLTGRGETCISVFSSSTYQVLQKGRQYCINPAHPEHMQRLINDVFQSNTLPCHGMIHLWSLDITPPEEASTVTLESDQALGVDGVVSLIQAVAGRALRAPQGYAPTQVTSQPRLWLVTRGAQPVGSASSELSLGQSPLWGLGRTCAIEHPELWGGLVDVDPTDQADDIATQLLTVIFEPHGEDQIAFRQGQSYVARLVRSINWAKQSLELRPDVSYLITGGLWGLGFEVARWMAKKGAQHLVLLARTQLPPRTNWDEVEAESRLARQIAGIRELEALGVHVHYAAIDVADEEQLTSFVEDFRRQHYPPIKGILHAASVWQDQQGQSLVRPLVNLDQTALKAVFRPKVLGSWLLHRLFQDTKLDFFVLFSSGASLFGSAAQGNYAAAGAFLDALAHYLRARQQPALSIDWGAVSETGFGATAEGLRVHEYWESHGIQRITPRHVLAALELLIPQNISQVGVLKLDWSALQQFYPQLTGLPLVMYLTSEGASESKPSSSSGQAESAILQRLSDADDAERQQLMEAYLCEKVAHVLRLPLSKIDVQQPLTALGLDSLMAIELKNRIELDLSVRIPIVTFLHGPSIAQFTLQLLDQLVEALPCSPPEPKVSFESGGGGLSTKEVPTPLASLISTGELIERQREANLITMISQEDAQQLLAQLDQLSDSEVDSLLNQIVQEEELN
jgi:NAD(P)-dependent dehydrogenase (short-subunit alcohol dehydrogenase family)/acyl carrier protein